MEQKLQNYDCDSARGHKVNIKYEHSTQIIYFSFITQKCKLVKGLYPARKNVKSKKEPASFYLSR